MGEQKGNVRTKRVDTVVPHDKGGFKLQGSPRVQAGRPHPNSGFGDTLSELEIEYAMDGGRVNINFAHYFGTISLYEDQFGDIEGFEPYYQKFKSEFGGDYEAWNKDSSSHQFRWEEATARHEFLHFYSYRTAVTDLWPKYEKDVSKHLGDESTWEMATLQWWKDNWSRHVELFVIMHEEIHIYTLKSMVEEYERFKQTGQRP